MLDIETVNETLMPIMSPIGGRQFEVLKTLIHYILQIMNTAPILKVILSRHLFNLLF